jgi:hypothetical protein
LDVANKPLLTAASDRSELPLLTMFLAGFLGVVGLIMVLAPTGFGRLAHDLRVSVPSPTPVSARIARAMGLVVLAAAVVVPIAST